MNSAALGMKQVYCTPDLIDAQRLRNFLARHAIEGTIPETASPGSTSALPATETMHSVCVKDEDGKAACYLVDEYRRDIVATAEDNADESDDSSDPLPATEGPVQRASPWLTVAFCLTCVGMSAGLWYESSRFPRQAFERLGWRDALEIAEGSYWAIFPAIVLHPTIEHLVVNLVGVLIFGAGIERNCGRRCWIFLALAATFIVASSEMAAMGQIGIGASGLMYTFYGFVLVASVQKRVVAPVLLLVFSIWLLYGAVCDLAAMLDYWLFDGTAADRGIYAHLCGFAFGILAALAFVVSWRPWLTRSAVVAALIAALIPLNGSPWLSTWLLARGDQAFRDGDARAAISWYSRVIERGREPAPTARAQRGLAYLESGNFETAFADFELAFEANPKLEYVLAYRAQGWALRSDFEKALADVNREIHDVRASAYAFAVRSGIYRDCQQLDEALKDVDTALRLDPGSADHWTSRAVVQLDECRHDAALTDVQRALSLKSDLTAGLLIRGMAFKEIAETRKARADLERCLEFFLKDSQLRPDDPWLQCSLAEVQLELFDIDRAPRRLDAARQHAERACQVAPMYWDAWEASGRVLFEQRQFAAAENHLTRCLELNPRAVWACCGRGLARHALGQTEGSLADFDRAIAVNRRFAYGYRCRGLVNHALSREQAALDDLTRALELNPRFAEAYRLRGAVRGALGDEPAGQADRNRAAELERTMSTGQP